MIIAVSILLIVLTFLLYSGAKGDYRLLFLRLVVILLLSWLTFGWVFTVRWERRPRLVAFLVDRSRSMELVRADTTVDRVLSFLQDEIKGVKQEVWFFADSVYRIEGGRGAKNPEEMRERTRLTKALEMVAKTKPGAIVLLSDGQDNGESDPITTAKKLGIPLYAVGFGGKGVRNLTIEEVELPASIYTDDTVTARVRLSSTGFTGQERCRLRFEGQTKEVVMSEQWSEQDVFFQIVFSQPGRKTVMVVAESLFGEVSYLDNYHARAIEVKPARLKVVYLTNHPNLQTRFIRRALERNSRFDVKLAVGFSGGFSTMRIPLESAEIFIVDGAEETVRDKGFWSTFRSRVEGGAGVLFLGGEHFKSGEELDKLLPIKGGRILRGEWTPVSSEEGRFLPFLNETGVDLSVVPPFGGIWSGTVEEANVKVWMTALENDAPLLLAKKFGKGKVVFLAAFPLWRWGFLPDFPSYKPTPLEVFLSGVIRYLSERDIVPFLLEANVSNYLAGEQVILNLQARAPDATPWEGLDVRVEVKDSAGASFVIPMQEMGMGSYQTGIEYLAPGKYFAVAEIRSENRLIKRTAPVEFSVFRRSVEFTRLGLNQELMSQIAEISKGQFVRAESVEVIDVQRWGMGVYRYRFSFDPRKSPIVYGLLAVLFGLEIILRRQQGLS
ncbi:MAG: hypothetical protein ACUVUD_00450 [bacterium]